MCQKTFSFLFLVPVLRALRRLMPAYVKRCKIAPRHVMRTPGQNEIIANMPGPTGFGFGSSDNRIMISNGPLPNTKMATPIYMSNLPIRNSFGTQNGSTF